jgi:hypothetical protein
MRPGEALDAVDVLYRLDGSVGRHHGWRRINASALDGVAKGHKGFTYKGKNVKAASTRLGATYGNFAVANDAGSSVPSRRVDFYSTAVVVDDSGDLKYWNPSTQAYTTPTENVNGRGAGVWLPTGVTALTMDPKPSFLVYNSNLYIVGLGANLRFDPVDRALYLWGWENAPSLSLAVAYTPAGTSDLIDGAVYKYRASWIDLYTGEESKLGDAKEFTISGNQGIDFGGAPASGVNIPNYSGDRHWVNAGDADDSDVGIAIYRTGPDGEKYHFLGVIYPDTAAATTWSDGTALVDDGLATATSIPGVVKDYEDPPVLNAFCQQVDMWWGISWDNNWARLYFNDFEGENSFWERWDPRQYKELPLTDGEFMTSVCPTNKSVVVMSNYNAYEVSPTPTAGGRIEKPVRELKWDVGCVSPKGCASVGGTVYFLSDRGPYRWRSGMAKPQWIGKNMQPLFIDPESDLCQMNAEGRLEAEIIYDLDADVVRMSFPCGPSTWNNRHITYSNRAAELNQRPDASFAFMSMHAQCFDFFNGLTGLGPDGLPVKPYERSNKLVFGDQYGYIYEYDPSLWTASLYEGSVTRMEGTVQGGSSVTLVVTEGGLFTTGDGLKYVWVEIEYANGTSEMRRIFSNTGTNIVPLTPFSADPTGATWVVGGYPSRWESWVDHMGDPHSHKRIRHIYVGFNKQMSGDDQHVEVSVQASNEWPSASVRTRNMTMDAYRTKKLVNVVGRFFTYMFAHTRPNEHWCITNFDVTKIAELMGRTRR